MPKERTRSVRGSGVVWICRRDVAEVAVRIAAAERFDPPGVLGGVAAKRVVHPPGVVDRHAASRIVHLVALREPHPQRLLAAAADARERLGEHREWLDRAEAARLRLVAEREPVLPVGPDLCGPLR